MKILTYEQLGQLGIRFSRVHLSRLEKASKFPLRVQLGANSIGWVESEIQAHLAALIAARSNEKAA